MDSKKKRRRPWWDQPGMVSPFHGESDTKLHRIWRAIRCNRDKFRVHPDWEVYQNFRDWARSHGYREGKVYLKRKNRYLGYNPKNCVWIRKKKIKAWGKRKTITEWTKDKRCVVGASTLRRRLERGFDPEFAISYKKKKRRKHYRRHTFSFWLHMIKEDYIGWENSPQFHDWCMANGYKKGMRMVKIDHWSIWSPTNLKFVHKSEAALYQSCINNIYDEHLFQAWGESKTITEWLEDPRCYCNSREILEERLKKGWKVAYAIRAHPFAHLRLTKTNSKVIKLISDSGEEKTVYWWSRTKRCKVSLRTLIQRLNRGVPLDVAMWWRRLEKDINWAVYKVPVDYKERK